MKNNMGLMLGAVVSVAMIGVGCAMVSNTKAARRRRMIKKVIKAVHDVGCAVQRITSF